MRQFMFYFLILVFGEPVFGIKCHNNPPSIPRQWITMKPQCLMLMRRQIQMEVAASLQYLALGAHFSQDNVNRPGFAELFLTCAGQERELVARLLDYLLMRGELTADLTSVVHRSIRPIEEKEWDSGAHALEFALKMEAEMTSHTRNVITACEEDDWNDYHLSDYLTGELLGPQLQRQRELAGRAVTLKKMVEKHSALGEFIYDKKMSERLALA